MTFENPPVESGPPAQPATSGLAVAALVIGILSLIFAVFVFPIGLIGGVVGIILGVIARGKVKRGEAAGGGMATGGIITSVLAILVAIAVGLLFVSVFSNVVDCVDPNLTEEEVADCVQGQLDSNLGG